MMTTLYEALRRVKWDKECCTPTESIDCSLLPMDLSEEVLQAWEGHAVAAFRLWPEYSGNPGRPVVGGKGAVWDAEEKARLLDHLIEYADFHGL